MSEIDEAIYVVDGVICDNIAHFYDSDRGLMSQNILVQMRNFVEYIAVKEYCKVEEVLPNDYEVIKRALKYIKSQANLRFLYKFHKMLQESVSHYTFGKDGSERLMLKYYEYLLKIKRHLLNNYNMIVLSNIDDFPLNTDKELSEYYEKIAERINAPSPYSKQIQNTDRYYVQKTKPFFVDGEIYYEVTITNAYSTTSKFDRLIAFTNFEIFDNYSVKFKIQKDFISILGKEMEILVIKDYEVSIRRCEWNNFAKLFGWSIKFNVYSNECKGLMEFISSFGMSLTELVCSDEQEYAEIKNHITKGCQTGDIFNLLDICHAGIINNAPGANIIRYLLLRMNNSVIKRQYSRDNCALLSELHLDYRCIPFEKMPYCSSLKQHNPKIYDILESIPVSNHEHELFVRLIKNNTELEGMLFTPRDELECVTNIDAKVKTYNSSLYYKHADREIMEYKGYLYIKEYAKDCAYIIKKLQELSASGLSNYTASVDSWIAQKSSIPMIDDPKKGDALRCMFSNSHVALIYGAAGTGKSTLISYIANFWAGEDKIFLANTHTAVNNMRSKVAADKSLFGTITSFLSKKNNQTSCHVLFIDECSTVSNHDMRQILDKADFKLLVLVGDIYQIESISFGNWFSISRQFVPNSSLVDLEKSFRSDNKKLLNVWDRVRNLDDSILEPLVKNGYVARLDESIFDYSASDEIILCHNYDGLYGINSINRLLQNNNPNPAIVWGINTYKVGDPVLFNESNIFAPYINNNAKGRILAVKAEELEIKFIIELEEQLSELATKSADFKVIGTSNKGNSIIFFSVQKYNSSDEDDDDDDDSTVVPFHVAYAVSIHKSQGLEYDSVKIVITDECEERITHNIFYTAITRAKKSLKIYWSPETEQAVLKRFKKKSFDRDAHLLANLTGIKQFL